MKPYIGIDEFIATLNFLAGSIDKFEQSFAKKFGASYGISFSYGRTGLYGLLKCLGITRAEIIVPAYTCSVVPDAVLLSGNIPVFIDCEENSFNMDIEKIKRAITKNTRMIIASHIYGYPMNIDELANIVNSLNYKVYLVHDCAHSYGAKWNGRLVNSVGDAAIYSLSMIKILCTVISGIVISNDKKIYDRILKFKKDNIKNCSIFKSISKYLYFLSILLAKNNTIYSLIDWIESAGILGKIIKYDLAKSAEFPADWNINITNFEARIGLSQLKKYDNIIMKRQELAQAYNKTLCSANGIQLPPLIQGATYSHYVCLVKDRKSVIEKARLNGVQLGTHFNIAVTSLDRFKKFANGKYPIADYYAEHNINLPIYPDLEPYGKEFRRICSIFL